MSTLDRMLSVLMAARESRHRSMFQLGSGETAPIRGRRSNRRRRSTTLATETLEQRQMLAITVYAQDDTAAAEDPRSWVTVVAEPGDNVFVQQVAGAKESLYIADNSSFTNRTMVGGTLAIGSTSTHLLPDFEARSLGKLAITAGYNTADAAVLPVAYPMLTSLGSDGGGWTGATIPANLGSHVVRDTYDRLSGVISIKEPDGNVYTWAFDNPLKYSYTGSYGDPTLISGIGYTEPLSVGQYYPTQIYAAGNTLRIQWNVSQLPEAPSVHVTGVDNGGRAYTDREFSLSADQKPEFSLYNATALGAQVVISSTVNGTVVIDGVKLDFTCGHGSDGNQLFFKSPNNAIGTYGFWRSLVDPTDNNYIANALARARGYLVPGTPLPDGTTPRRLVLLSEARDSVTSSWYSTGFSAVVENVSYAVERNAGAAVTATIFAGHDINASVDINLNTPGSSAYIDSPIRVVDTGIRQPQNYTDRISINATNIQVNAAVSTAGLIQVGTNTTASSNDLGSQAYGLERASAFASVSGTKVSELTIPAGSEGAGYLSSAPPKVTISPAVALRASAALSTLVNGKLVGFKVLSPGFGYTAAPVVTFSDPQLPGGVRYTGVATVEKGEVTDITITKEGSGYITAPTITLTAALGTNGPIGTGASVVAVFVGSIGGIRLIESGAGYVPNSYVDLLITSSGSGKGAQARAVINSVGSVDRIELANGGEGYATTDTTVTLPSPNNSSAGRQATATAVVDSVTGRLKGLVVDDPGSGYGQVPTVTIEAPRMVNAGIRAAATIDAGGVTGVELVAGGGLKASVVATTAAGAVVSAVVEPSTAGAGYKVGELLSLDSQLGGTGQAALLRVVAVDSEKHGGVTRLEAVWGGGGYKIGEVLVHDGKPNRGYGYTVAPQVWIERPQLGDGVQAVATATLDAVGQIRQLAVAADDRGRGYSSSSLPAVSVLPERPLAKAESVVFNAATAATWYTISVDDDRSTRAVDRSTLLVTTSALLSGTIAYNRDDATTPAESIMLESHRGDVFVYGSIIANKQSYLLQSDAQDVMLFPYRFAARVPGDLPEDGELISVIKGETVAITLANDLPTFPNGVAANDVDLVTQIDSLRIRAAWRSGAERSDPFPYSVLIEEADDISIDALAASGWPLIFAAVGNMQTNAVIDTASDFVVKGVKGLSVTAPIKSRRNVTIEAQTVAVNNSIDALYELAITASQGTISLSGGTVHAGGTVRLNQKNVKVAKTIDYSSVSTPKQILKGQTVSVPIVVSGDFSATDVNVTLSLTNPTLQYLSASLVSPYGARVPLFLQGALTGTNMKDAVFNDQASKTIRQGTAPYTVSTTDPTTVVTEKGFRPDYTSLGNLNGYGVAGTWKLEVTNPNYGSEGTIDSVVLSLLNPAGGSTGSITSTATIAADGLVIEAEGDVTAKTDVNTVNAATEGNLTLDDQGAMEVVSARAAGAVWLTADGVDPVTTDPETNRRKFGAALKATLVDVGSFFVAARRGSVDVNVTAAKSITIAGNPNYTTDTTHGNGVAAGSVNIRSLGGSTGGDIAVFDAPLAGGVDTKRQVKLATQGPLADVQYVAGTAGLYLSTLTATKNGALAAALGGSVSLQNGNAILIKDGTVDDGAKTNGIYTVVDPGSATTRWKLARSIDADTVQELPAGSIVKVVTGTTADAYFRIDYQTTAEKPFGYADVAVQPLKVTANIGTDDPTDTVRFVVSNDSSLGTTDNSSPGSLGKMINLAQQNDTSSSESNPVQKTEFLFSTSIKSAIKLKQELPLIRQPLNIDGALRWDPLTNAAESGIAVAVDGSRIVTSATGAIVTSQTVVNGFVFTPSSGGTQAGSLAHMNVGGFQGAAVKIDSAQNVVVDSNLFGVDQSGNRLGNRIGVMVTGSSAESTNGVTISNNKIGSSGVAAVSLEGNAAGVSLFGNTIGFNGGDNVIGVDVTTSGQSSIGLEDRNRNVVGYNTTGIRLGAGSGNTTIVNSEISHNVISGISIQGGKHQIGVPTTATAAARNAVFANSGWGIRIDGKTGDSSTALLDLANNQKISNNLFISPAAAPGDTSTRNRIGAIGIRNAPLTTVGDFSLKAEGKKYEVDPITGTDSQGNQYIALADTVGPDLRVQPAKSVSGPLPSTITSSGLTVKGSDATRVKVFVLRIVDGGSGVNLDTVVREAFSLTLNGSPLAEGTDYTFSFSGGTANEVSFTCKTATGFFAQGRYVLTATGKSGTSSGSGSVTGGSLTDAANNPLKGNQTDPDMANVAKFTLLLSDVPGTVTGVTPVLGDASATVSWTAPQAPVGAPITNYVLEYAAAGGVWKEFIHPVSTATSLTVTGLTNGVSYNFHVAAVNEAGQGTFSAASSSVTPRTLASAPLNLQASAGDSSVLLAWAAPLSDGGATITDYAIQKSTDGGKAWSDVVDGVSISTTATVSGLNNGTAYLFRVATVTTAGRGGWTAASGAVKPIGLPGIASNLVARAAEGSAVLTWTAPASNGAVISDYSIQKSTDGTNWVDVVDGVSAAATATVSGLTNGMAYVFRVAAKTVAGTGGWTAKSEAVIPISRASAPLNLQAVADDGQAALSWVMPASTSGATVTDYLIQKSVNGGTTWSDVVDGVSSETTTTLTGLTNGLTYVFRVAAVTSVGAGVWTPASTEVIPYGLVSVPQNIQGVASDGQVALTWDPPASTGGLQVYDYLLESSSDGGMNWTAFTDAVAATTGATVTGLTNGASYLFRVAAVTNLANATSDFSQATAAIIPLAAPGAVTSLRSVPGSNQIVLVWQAPTKNGGRPVMDYEIEYKAVGSVSWVPYSHVATTATTATIAGLSANNGYVFRVTPVTDFSRGLPAETTEAVVLLPQPTRLAGRAANGSVLLTWMAPKANPALRVIDYRIQYSADGGATWITASKTASTAARATVRGLTNGTGYIFRVAAVTAKGLGAYSVSSARLIPKRV